MRASLQLYNFLESHGFLARVQDEETRTSCEEAWISLSSFSSKMLARLPTTLMQSSRIAVLRDHVGLLERTLAILLEEVSSSKRQRFLG
jgi:hypothetical protein